MAAPSQIGRLAQAGLTPAVSGDAFHAARQEYRSFRTLVERAVDVFGDEMKASLWLSTPSADFDGKVPMQVAQAVEYKAEEIERIFEPVFLRIEHGIYS